MSLPSTVRWEYNHKAESGSAEEKLIDVLKNPKEWV
jgi:coproporphyrinogen III oxidase